MKQYLLTVTAKNDEGEIFYQERFSLQNHYVVGRTRKKCQDILLSFSTPITPIILPQASKLSGFHCVFYQDKSGYWLIDGWGEYRSTNGVIVNGRRTEFAMLRHDDIILLGCPEVFLKYEIERELTEAEKATAS